MSNPEPFRDPAVWDDFDNALEDYFREKEERLSKVRIPLSNGITVSGLMFERIYTMSSLSKMRRAELLCITDLEMDDLYNEYLNPLARKDDPST